MAKKRARKRRHPKKRKHGKKRARKSARRARRNPSRVVHRKRRTGTFASRGKRGLVHFSGNCGWPACARRVKPPYRLCAEHLRCAAESPC